MCQEKKEEEDIEKRALKITSMNQYEDSKATEQRQITGSRNSNDNIKI